MWLGVNRCQQCAWLPHSGGHGWWFEQMPPSTHTTPTDHTSPPPLKLLLYSMQSDKSNSEIGFANPNENHVQGENFHWRCMHLNNMCFGGFIATKKNSLAAGRWRSWQASWLTGKEEKKVMCHTFTCLSIHLHKGYASNLANQVATHILRLGVWWQRMGAAEPM